MIKETGRAFNWTLVQYGPKRMSKNGLNIFMANRALDFHALGLAQEVGHFTITTPFWSMHAGKLGFLARV